MFDGKFVLLVDMDDVMENLMDVWFEMLDEIQANNPTYRSIKMKDHTSWDVVPLYPMLTVDEIFQPLNMPEIWQRITPIPGAVRVLKDKQGPSRSSPCMHCLALYRSCSKEGVLEKKFSIYLLESGYYNA